MSVTTTPASEGAMEQERIAEDFQQYLQFIPEQYCQMCESTSEDYDIVPNSEESSRKQYPWFCTQCEDASEVVDLRAMFVAEVEEENKLSHALGVTEGRELERRRILVVMRAYYQQFPEEVFARNLLLQIEEDITPPQEEPKLNQILKDQKEEDAN